MKTWEEFIVGKNRTIFNKPYGQYQDGHTEVALTESIYNELVKSCVAEGLRLAAEKCKPHGVVKTETEIAQAILSLAEQIKNGEKV